MLEDTATMMRPPPRPLNMDGESLSTRALNKMYRESRGEAFFSNAPVVSPSGSSTSVPTATSPNLSWLNHPPLPSTSSLSHNHAFRPRQTQNTRSRSEQSIASVQSDSSRRRYHGGHSDDRPSSRSSNFRPETVRSSTPSFDAMPMSLAGLDLTDPWGYSFRSDSPYDALLPPPTMPVQKPRALGDRRGTSSSIRSASHSSMSYIPEQSQYEEEPQQVYRESPADSQLHSSSSAISLDGHLSKSSDGRSAPSSALGVGRKRVASTSDVPHSVNAFGLNRPAALPSKLNHVSNHHDAKTTNTATNKEIAKQQRKFSWFRSRASRGDLGIVRTSTASSSKPSLFADDTASSVSMRTTTSSLRSAATGNTPPLSLSTSSAASSSIDTNLETNSTAASFVSTSDRSSPPLSAELVAPQPYSMYTSSKIIADHQKELGQSVSSTQTVTSAHQQRKSKLSRRSSPNLAAAKTQGQEEQTQTSKSRRISLVASAFSRKPKKLAVPQSPLPPYASDEDDADSTPTAGQGAVVLPADLPLPSVDADPRPISSQPSIPISQSLEHPPVVSHRTAIQMALAEMPTAVKRSASPSSKLLPNPAPDAATTTAALLQTISTLSTSPSGSASADNVTLCDGPARQVQVRTSSASLREPNVQPTVTVASTAEASPLLDWPGELPYSPRVDSPQICSA